MPSDDAFSPAARVPEAYDRIAEAWRAAGDFRERRFLDRLVAGFPPGAQVLDVGCGCGAPIGAYLAGRGFRLTGLDASARLLSYARKLLPAATFIQGDMRTADPGGPFDAVVAWDSVFHLPRDDHAALFRRFHSWLRSGGRLLVS